MPCATTLCVINLGQTEAKVEALFDSFVSLQEEANSDRQEDNGGNQLFMYDDEDNYQASSKETMSQATRYRYC